MQVSASQSLLIVTGMHRSGTSALCAALAACGVSFGDRLLGAIAGVNDEGFWEDARVVDINEELLTLAGSNWYSLAHHIASIDWNESRFEGLRESAASLLKEGFGDAVVQAVKDPRFCLTLPFWLMLCEELGIPARVCVIVRAPIEVARSLEKRDGFPRGYGLRLYALYSDCIKSAVPPGADFVRFDDLLLEPKSVILRIESELQLTLAKVDVTGIRADLRHQRSSADHGLLANAHIGDIDIQALMREIDIDYPMDQTLTDFADKLTARGQELTQIGVEHAAALATIEERDEDIEALSVQHRQALATIDQRDTDIEALSAEHRAALATIDERDEQIREFDRRLSQLGEEHSHALQTLRERDAELAWIKQRLETISKVPGVGYLIRRMRKHAQG